MKLITGHCLFVFFLIESPPAALLQGWVQFAPAPVGLAGCWLIVVTCWDVRRAPRHVIATPNPQAPFLGVK